MNSSINLNFKVRLFSALSAQNISKRLLISLSIAIAFCGAAFNQAVLAQTCLTSTTIFIDLSPSARTRRAHYIALCGRPCNRPQPIGR